LLALTIPLLFGFSLLRNETISTYDETGSYPALRPFIHHARSNGAPDDLFFGSTPADMLLVYYQRIDRIPFRRATGDWKKELPSTRRVWIFHKTFGFWPGLPQIARSMGTTPDQFQLVKQEGTALLYLYTPPR
jgi:hypothetical protein